jgi:RNA-binding protein Nova
MIDPSKVIVKFLIPNVAAGVVIGKGGSYISQMQTESKARMHLSKPEEYFPGSLETHDRILVISGTVEQLLAALHLLLTKLSNEPSAKTVVQGRSPDTISLRLLVHNRLVGTLIGKGGNTIRAFHEDSKASFNISAPPIFPGLNERIVRVTGDIQQIMRGVALLVTKLSENPDYHMIADANVDYTSHFQQQQQQQYMGYHPNPQLEDPMALDNAPNVSLNIPEAKVGAIIGKSGSVLNQMRELLGVSIKIGKRGELVEGGRTCVITGLDQESVEITERLIKYKISLKTDPMMHNGH